MTADLRLFQHLLADQSVAAEHQVAKEMWTLMEEIDSLSGFCQKEIGLSGLKEKQVAQDLAFLLFPPRG